MTPRSIEIRQQLDPPDPEGVVDVWLEPDPRLGMSGLEGYFGPCAAVTASAREDHVRIPQGDGRVAVLVKVFVDTSQRRHGVGTALVHQFLETCRASDVDSVYLYAEIPDEDMDLVGWYVRMGFERLYPADERHDPEMVTRLRSPAVA
jgi:GNAT superfamily N-acetyltransferase